MLKSIESLVDETLQIYEFHSEEENAIREICETIVMILKQLKASVSVNTSLLASDNNVKRAVLGQDGHIMVVYSNKEVEYKKLTDYRPAILMDILNDIFPKLKDATIEYKKSIEERVSIYRTANKKMRKIDQVLKENHGSGMEDVIEDMQSDPVKLKQ